jgi:small subunit ribosomal protein S27Ae
MVLIMAEEKEKKEKAPVKKEKKKAPKAYRKLRSCPKCGPGVRLGDHKDRFACGRCGYMEKK